MYSKLQTLYIDLNYIRSPNKECHHFHLYIFRVPIPHQEPHIATETALRIAAT
jgi:hypothetical protein